MQLFDLRGSCLLLAVGLLSGCASGPTLSDSQNDQQLPVKGMSKIAVYRTGLLGAAIQPTVVVDGTQTGRCTPNGVFMIDVPIGQHNISTTTESTTQTLVETKQGATSYVKCSIGLGFIVGRPKLEVVSGTVGAAEASNLSLTGSY